MEKKNKIMIIITSIIAILVITGSVAFAIFTFTRSGTNGELVLGDIWMKYEENNGIALTNALPGDEYSSYFEFTISGKNTYEKKDIWYDIVLTRGEVPSDKTEDNRIEDKYLKFKLVEVSNNVETEIFTDTTYEDLTSQRIHVEKILAGANEFAKTYRLYMVISEKLTFGNSSDAILTQEEFENLFGSIKVKVNGDFNEKVIEVPKSGAETIIEKVATYAVASESNFEGGLVGINTSGTLYNETASEEVREYRYIGPTVNNYTYFNCKDTDGTYNYGDDNYDYANNCETWRIVGTFKNANGEWNLKLMRNTMLTSDELPATYVVNGTTYTIENSTTGRAYWNKPDTLKSTNYNDWTTGGLQYFLNTANDTNGTAGYYSTLTSKTKELIDEEYTYHLGNVDYESTTKVAYADERDEAKIYSGNQPTWNGAVGLLYPSDYGYSALSSNWDTLMSDYDGEAMNTSWMQQTANHTDWEWLLSPSSSGTDCAMVWSTSGGVGLSYVNDGSYDNAVRPVLNLKSNVKILKGDGSENSPYIFIGE